MPNLFLTNEIRQKFNHSHLLNVHIPYLMDHLYRANIEHPQKIVIVQKAIAKIIFLLLSLHHHLLLIPGQLGKWFPRFRLENASFPLNHIEWHNSIRISTPLFMAIIPQVLIHLRCDKCLPIQI